MSEIRCEDCKTTLGYTTCGFCHADHVVCPRCYVKREEGRLKWIRENPMEAYAAAQNALDMWSNPNEGLAVRDILKDAPNPPTSPTWKDPKRL
jgi:hypothetical protein